MGQSTGRPKIQRNYSDSRTNKSFRHLWLYCHNWCNGMPKGDNQINHPEARWLYYHTKKKSK